MEKVALTTILMLEEEGLEATSQGISGLLKGKEEEYFRYANLPSHGYYRTISKRKLTMMVNGLAKKGLVAECLDGELIFLSLTEEGRSECLPSIERRKVGRFSPQIRKKEN